MAIVVFWVMTASIVSAPVSQSDASRAAKAARHSAREEFDPAVARELHAKSDLAAQHPDLVPRLESRLIAAWQLALEQGAERSAGLLSDSGAPVEGTKVQVIVQCEPQARPQEVAAALVSRNARIIRTGEAHVKAAVPIAVLDQVARLPGVAFVRLPIRPREKNTVITEGRAATFAGSWNTAGFTGQGVKVAVIDDGFAGLSSRKANDEIPASAIGVDFTGTGISSGTEVHGCACAEIIYDMAPGVQLYLIKTADPSDDEAAKNYCKTQGVQIISQSAGYDALNFHDGIAYSSITPNPVAIANDAAASGILWVNAAGNEALQHALVQWQDANANAYLDWTSTSHSINELWNGGNPIPAGTTIDIFLTWNAWPVTGQDFDLDLYRSPDGVNWTYVTTASDPQNGTQAPREHLNYTVGTTARYGVAIYKYSATTAPWFILRSYPYELFYYGYDNYETPVPGSVCIPADAASVFSVGAIDYTTYTNGPIEDFSSLGPNNGAYTGNPTVMKPDICGPDGVSTVTYGSANFLGTSASTPHIAGLAALVKGRFPAYSNTQIRSYLESYGVDLGAPGKDATFGSGPCVLPQVVSIDLVPPTIAISSPTNGQTLTTASFTVTGSASDPGSPASGLAQVEVRLNGGSWSNATGTTSWTRAVTLAPCSNTIEARSRDLAGNYSSNAFIAVTFNASNTVPAQPTNVLPQNGATNVTITPTLQASAFSDADCTGDTHTASQWQVLNSAGSTVVADSGTNTLNLTSWAVPASELYYGSNYLWRVRYRDSRNGWSSNSTPTTFTTAGPLLNELKLGTNLVFTWPTNAPGFVLQWSTNLNPQIWSNALPTPVIVNGLYTVTNTLTNNARFYRLKK